MTGQDSTDASPDHLISPFPHFPISPYDPRHSYEWNYEHAPAPERIAAVSPDAIPPVPGSWSFLGFPVSSPLGIPAGPLLNGRWLLWYAGLGFDVLTYKTVRSRARDCYPLPNLQPVDAPVLTGGEPPLTASPEMRGSWAISFGMPSRPPEVWRRDVEWTRERLPPGKVLVVSVVGTMQPGWTLDDLAEDYAVCTRWAVESGAHAVEANLSCPNVSTADGQLYQLPESAARVARAVREAAGDTSVLLKIGHVTQRADAEALVRAVAPFVDGLSMVNCLASRVRQPSGDLLFNGEPRGIGGDAIREAAVAQVALFREVIDASNERLEITGVGGISTADRVRGYLAAGARTVQLATAAMRDPAIGVKIRSEWGE